MPPQIAVLTELARGFPDRRTGKNFTYRMEDARVNHSGSWRH